MIKTQEFTQVVGEGYSTVRNAYKEEARTPRPPGDFGHEFLAHSHRRFVVADALAWRLTRELSIAGMLWEDAATAVRESQFSFSSNLDEIFADAASVFSVWFLEGQNQPLNWFGSAAQAAEMMDRDAREHPSRCIERAYMVGMKSAFLKACEIAEGNGYFLNMKTGEIDHIEVG